MNGGHHVVRLLKPEVKYILLALAAIVCTPGGIAYGSDVKEYEGNTMTFEITKPTTSTGYNYPEKVRYSYSVNDGTAKSGSDYSVPDGKTGKIVFPEGSATTAKININLFEDDLDEGSGETLEVVLTSPQYEAASGMYLYGFYLPTRLTFDGLILDPD